MHVNAVSFEFSDVNWKSRMHLVYFIVHLVYDCSTLVSLRLREPARSGEDTQLNLLSGAQNWYCTGL